MKSLRRNRGWSFTAVAKATPAGAECSASLFPPVSRETNALRIGGGLGAAGLAAAAKRFAIFACAASEAMTVSAPTGAATPPKTCSSRSLARFCGLAATASATAAARLLRKVVSGSGAPRRSR